MKLLCIEDDPEISRFIKQNFTQVGHSCEVVNNAHDGLACVRSVSFDLIIVDRLLPDMEGLELISTFRSEGINVPIIVLSALSKVNHRVMGLKAGADDYLVKPFEFSELAARVEALHRRGGMSVKEKHETTLLKVADLSVDLTTQKVMRSGQNIELLSKEYDLLKALMQHYGQVVTRTMLLEIVWGLHFDPQTNVVDVHISRLRQKIDKPFDRPLLHTIRGKGYCLQEMENE